MFTSVRRISNVKANLIPFLSNYTSNKRLCKIMNLQTHGRQFFDSKNEDTENFLSLLKCYSRKEFYDQGENNYLDFTDE